MFLLPSKWKWKVLVTKSCLTLCDPRGCILPGSSVHGILQARILEWVAISFSRGSSWLRNWMWVSHVAGRFFAIWAIREAPGLMRNCNCSASTTCLSAPKYTSFLHYYHYASFPPARQQCGITLTYQCSNKLWIFHDILKFSYEKFT